MHGYKTPFKVEQRPNQEGREYSIISHKDAVIGSVAGQEAAKLFAAAPELLDALSTALTYMEAHEQLGFEVREEDMMKVRGLLNELEG